MDPVNLSVINQMESIIRGVRGKPVTTTIFIISIPIKEAQ